MYCIFIVYVRICLKHTNKYTWFWDLLQTGAGNLPSKKRPSELIVTLTPPPKKNRKQIKKFGGYLIINHSFENTPLAVLVFYFSCWSTGASFCTGFFCHSVARNGREPSRKDFEKRLEQMLLQAHQWKIIGIFWRVFLIKQTAWVMLIKAMLCQIGLFYKSMEFNGMYSIVHVWYWYPKYWVVFGYGDISCENMRANSTW